MFIISNINTLIYEQVMLESKFPAKKIVINSRHINSAVS